MNQLMSVSKVALGGLCLLLAIGCSQEQKKSDDTSGSAGVTEQNEAMSEVTAVNQMIKNDQFEQALTRLDELGQLPDTTRQRLREKAHLNYGLYLEYRADDQSMRDRMTSALRQFIEVLHINRENQKALSEIKQIMGIYGTMPDKSPPSDIKKDLNALGVRY